MEGKFLCSGDCLKCMPAQRTYCASQHAYSNMKVLDQLMSEVLSIKEKIEAMQNNEAMVFDLKAQEGEAAQTIGSRDSF